MSYPFADKQPRHAGEDSEGLRQEALPSDARAGLCTRGREDNHLQGWCVFSACDNVFVLNCIQQC